jgi:hypothetical protein
MDTLMELHPLETGELRHRAGLGASTHTRPFEKAMAELQRKLWVVKTEEVYDPSFCYRWDLLENWLPGQVKRGHELSRNEAIRQVLTHYLKIVVASQERIIARLFDVSAGEVEEALARLDADGLITRGVSVRNLPGRWVLWEPPTP